MKQGVLRMDTRIYVGNMTFKIPEGTNVLVKDGNMKFVDPSLGLLPFEGFKRGDYFISVDGVKRKVRFPDGTENGNIPFPWLLL